MLSSVLAFFSVVVSKLGKTTSSPVYGVYVFHGSPQCGGRATDRCMKPPLTYLAVEDMHLGVSKQKNLSKSCDTCLG